MKTFKFFGIFLGVVVLLLTIVAILRPQGNRVTIICNNTFIQGEQGNISVCVTNLSNSMPVAGIKVRISAYKNSMSQEYTTNSDGFANVLFDTSDIPCGKTILFVTAAKNGETLNKSSFDIEVKGAQKLELFTDKPIYQPGQTIHTKLLVTNKLSGRPATQQQINLEIRDPRNNVICKKQLVSSKFGIAWKDIALAKEIMPGEYTIHAAVNDESVTRKVQIQEYQLPRFTTDLDYSFRYNYNYSSYMVTGSFSVAYITGKEIQSPTLKAQVTFLQNDVQKSQDLSLENKDGKYHFRYELPKQVSSCKLIVEVADGSGHVENITRKLYKSSEYSSDSPVTVYVVPENPHFDTQRANTFFVYAFHRDGSPAQCRVYVDCYGSYQECETNSLGLAEVQLNVESSYYVRVLVEAWFKGQKQSIFFNQYDFGGRRRYHYDSKYNKFDLSTHVCQAGETIYAKFADYNPRRGTYCVRLLHNNIALAMDIASGANVSIPIPKGLSGTVTVQSVFIDHELGDNHIQEEAVVVAKGDFLDVTTKLDREEYRPGAKAKLSIQVQNRQTKQPEVAAVSLNVVDRSVIEMFTRIAANNGISMSPIDHLLCNIEKCTDKKLVDLGVRARHAFVAYQSRHKDVYAQSQGLQIVDDGADEIWDFRRRQIRYQESIIGISILIACLSLLVVALAKSSRLLGFFISIVVIGLLAAMLLPALSQVSEKARQSKTPGNVLNAQIVPQHVRQHFPETMYFQPQIISDENGNIDVEIPVADSITTFNIEAEAISVDGLRGKSEQELRVFQPFFIELNTPSSFIQNDQVQVSVAIYNHLQNEQQVAVSLQQQPWFEIVGDTRRVVTIDKEGSAHFTIRVLQAGQHSLTAVAQVQNNANNTFSDGIRRVVKVIPDGKRMANAWNGKLQKNIAHHVDVPKNAMHNQVMVKYYPKATSVVVEGLDSMLRTPHGCFEQTSSTSFPNVLILQYLRKIDQKKGQRHAEALIELGYQRIISFESSNGGFEWYGRNPGVLWLTAYGIQQLHATAKVHEVDMRIVDRCYHFIEKQQKPDGSWGNPQLTAYITWSLCEAGMSERKAVKNALAYWEKERKNLDDTYVLALLANTYAFANKQNLCAEILQKLMANCQRKSKTMYWKSPTTLTRAYGKAADIETTALIAYAMLHSQFNSDVTPVLDYLINERDANGIWGSTHATILALKTLIASETKTEKTPPEMVIDIAVNDNKIHSWTVSHIDYDVVKQLDISKWLDQSKNKVELHCNIPSNALYQISQKYYAPRKKAKKQQIDFSIKYHKETVKLGTNIIATTSLKYHGNKHMESMMVELGIPSGFSVGNAIFEELVKKQHIDHYALQENKVILYVGEFSSTSELSFSYELRSKTPLEVKTPTSVAYEYYEPTIRTEVPSIQLTVTE